MTFHPFQKFIYKAANSYGMAGAMTASKICHDFRKILPEILKKEDVHKFVSPAYYKDATLTINVDSPAWAQEVIMRKPQIIDEMNRIAGKKMIKDLKTKLHNQRLDNERGSDKITPN